MARTEDSITMLVRQAIDLHLHIGPEIIPRKYTAHSLLRAEKGRLAGAVLKNHCYPTVLVAAAEQAADFKLIPGLVLNRFVGGLNPEAVYATSLLANGPFVVWLPTMHAAQFLKSTAYEIAPEWVRDASLSLRRSSEIVPVAVTLEGRLTRAAKDTIDMIAKTGAVLATGHIAPQETELVAACARQQGVRAVIVTHPIYQHIAMPLSQQRRLAAQGCYMEHCASMYRLDGISLDEIAGQIRALGPEYIVLSSDMGQAFSPSPSGALADFARELQKRGISLEMLRTMLVANPRKILGISE